MSAVMSAAGNPCPDTTKGVREHANCNANPSSGAACLDFCRISPCAADRRSGDRYGSDLTGDLACPRHRLAAAGPQRHLDMLLSMAVIAMDQDKQYLAETFIQRVYTQCDQAVQTA